VPSRVPDLPVGQRVQAIIRLNKDFMIIAENPQRPRKVSRRVDKIETAVNLLH